MSTEQIKEFSYRVFNRFGQAKFPDGVSVLGSSQFSILPQLPRKTMLGLKVFKNQNRLKNKQLNSLILIRSTLCRTTVKVG